MILDKYIKILLNGIYDGVKSQLFFYLVLGFNIVLLFTIKFFPSMDGPAHLYNANIISHLLRGNESLSEFFMINKIWIPNWTSHAILAFFQFIFPAWMAEKILLIIYIAGMALSFRYLINQINPESVSLSILIFPFIYSFLFHLGFYNFSLSFILFFLTVGLWIRRYLLSDRSGLRIIFILFTIMYFTNVLMYAFLGFSCGLITIYFALQTYRRQKSDASFRFLLKELILLFLLSFPTLILFLIFYNTVHFYPSDERYPIAVLLQWILDARPFIVFDYNSEKSFTKYLFYVLIVLMLIDLVKNAMRKTFRVHVSDVFLVLLFVAFILYILTPNGASAGMMSDRYALVFLMFLLVWIVSRVKFTWIHPVLIVIVMYVHVKLLLMHFNKDLRMLDKHVKTLYAISEHIEDNSIVLPINFSDHWMEIHFSNYIGCAKPLILLENYESTVDWFPIKLNYNRLPNIFLHQKNFIPGIEWKHNPDSQHKRQIDYVVIYGDINKLNDPFWNELKEQIDTGFNLVHTSDDVYVTLYKRI